MSKADNEFINTSEEQKYELEDWLYRNEFSKKQSNVTELKKIILEKLKGGDSAKNVKWTQLDEALKNNSYWFNNLTTL